MALHPIWKLQLTLVSYGNEYLTKNLSIHTWLNHSIFRQQQLSFRDLLSQHLLAQHFQVWLEGLKKQGCKKLSLHCADLLKHEKNPNPNVELIPYAHFIVSHHAKHKTAWIFGQELAEWYQSDYDYELPSSQKSLTTLHTMWCFELEHKLSKKIDDDLIQPKWDDVDLLLQKEFFDSPLCSAFVEPENQDLTYDGLSEDDLHLIHKNKIDVQILSLLPSHNPAPFAHQTLHRLEALTQYIEQLLRSRHEQEPPLADPESYLRFSKKLEQIMPTILVHIANHYPTAQLTPESERVKRKTSLAPYMGMIKKAGAKQVLVLVIILSVLSVLAYYFSF